MARQYITVGFPNPNFVSETGARQEILPGVLVSETSLSGSGPVGSSAEDIPQRVRDPSGVSINALPQVWQSPLLTTLKSKDTFFGAPGQGPANLDWPVPRGASRSISLLTWIATAQLVVTQSPFTQTDWPNPPRGPLYPIVARTWTDQLKLNLLGQDRFFGLGGNPNFDWPNPRGVLYPVATKTWTDPVKLNLLGQDRIFGAPGQVPTYDWSNPRVATPAIDLRTWLQGISLSSQAVVVYPASFNYDWPNPRGPIAPIVHRTWADSVKLNLLGKDQFFGAPGQPPANTDWQNPRGSTPAISLRSWTQSLQTASLIVSYPASQYDWPNPRGPVASIDLRTWIETVNLELIGKDQFFGAPGQPPANEDWPNPQRVLNPAGIAAKSETDVWQNPLLTTMAAVVVATLRPPLITRIWSLDPSGVAVNAQEGVWQNTLSTLAKPIVFPATFHFDWPNPRGATPAAINLRAEIYPLNINITPVTPPPPPPPPPQPGSPTRPSGGWDWKYQDPNDKPAHARRKKNYAKARYEEDQVLQLLHMMDKADDDELDEMLSDAGYPELVQRDDEDNGTRH